MSRCWSKYCLKKIVLWLWYYSEPISPSYAPNLLSFGVCGAHGLGRLHLGGLAHCSEMSLLLAPVTACSMPDNSPSLWFLMVTPHVLSCYSIYIFPLHPLMLMVEFVILLTLQLLLLDTSALSSHLLFSECPMWRLVVGLPAPPPSWWGSSPRTPPRGTWSWPRQTSSCLASQEDLWHKQVLSMQMY